MPAWQTREATPELVFVGFNSRVAALDSSNGKIVWEWKAPEGYGYVSIMPIEGDRLVVSVVGYTYCLDATNGRQIWYNSLPGFGTGVASLASTFSQAGQHVAMAAAATAAQSSGAAAAA